MYKYTQTYTAPCDNSTEVSCKEEKEQEIYGNSPRHAAYNLRNFRNRMGLERASLVECKQDIRRSGRRVETTVKGKPATKRGRLRLADVMKGGAALVDIIKGDIATQEEIDRRASICAECPRVSQTGDCSACGGARRAAKFAGDLAQKYGKGFKDPFMKGQFANTGRASSYYCGFCGCSILNLILSRSKHFLKKETDQRPDNCWANPKSENWID